MAGQLIPPPGCEASLPKGLTPQEKIFLWADLVDATEELVKVGLRRKIGPDGNLDEAFKQWYERQTDEHDRTVIKMMREIRERLNRHAG